MSVDRVRATLQHYVPQLLLRGFASGRRNPLYVFDKRTGQSFRSSVRNAGCERGFYDPRNQSAVNVDEWMKQAAAGADAAGKSLRAFRKYSSMLVQRKPSTDCEPMGRYISTPVLATPRVPQTPSPGFKLLYRTAG